MPTEPILLFSLLRVELVKESPEEFCLNIITDGAAVLGLESLREPFDKGVQPLFHLAKPAHPLFRIRVLHRLNVPAIQKAKRHNASCVAATDGAIPADAACKTRRSLHHIPTLQTEYLLNRQECTLGSVPEFLFIPVSPLLSLLQNLFFGHLLLRLL